jgi:hypothetical protein
MRGIRHYAPATQNHDREHSVFGCMLDIGRRHQKIPQHVEGIPQNGFSPQMKRIPLCYINLPIRLRVKLSVLPVFPRDAWLLRRNTMKGIFKLAVLPVV